MTDGDAPRRARRRPVVALVLGGVVVAGVLVATRLADPWGDAGGDLLYAVAAYVLLVLALPRTRPVVAGVVAVAWCWLVEALQATGLVAAVVDAVPPAAWALGSTFAVRDLVLYLAGAALAVAADSAPGRTAARRAGVTRRARTSG